MKRTVLGLMPESLVVSMRDDLQPIYEEAGLIEAARTDPTAFDALYQRYLTPVYRYMCLHCANSEEAADLTQQVFLQALQALPRYRDRQLPFAAWLFRIARNLAIDSQRRHRNSFSWDGLPEPLQPLAEDDPETIFLENERLVQLRRLLQSLKPDKRELLALRFGAGFTAREIGAVVGKREAAVQKQLVRTLEQLRRQFKEQGR